MSLTPFHDGWIFHRTADADGEAVTLPHDAMIGEPRTATGGTAGHGGFFPGGSYRYSKVWIVPAASEQISYSLLFEGVQGATRVLVDGREAGVNRNGYREFAVPLGDVTPGSEVLIEVLVDKSIVPSDRWYSGAGIYRPVVLEAVGPVRIARDGVSLAVVERGVSAAVDIAVHVDGMVPAGAEVAVSVVSGGEIVVRSTSPITRTGRADLLVAVPAARYWSAEHPHLYDVHVTLSAGDVTLDERSLRTGLRTVEVDSVNGLRVNGEPVLLRGAAVHHDNGVLGAATHAAAEHRRARLLKDAGYNAIRSAHNPLSRHFLDACDEFGLYVMDELTDVWFGRKTAGDGSARFRDEWRVDVDAMIAKDRTRPSVIMYSIGNEIGESATPDGAALAREIHAHVAASDPTRPTTLAVNPLLAMMAIKAARRAARAGEGAASGSEPPERSGATSTAANLVTAKLGRLMVGASLLPAADAATRDAFAAVDIAGYNYAYASYPGARRRYPSRVIVGTESMPGDLPAIWKRVTTVPGVLGDFNWTGWDYLGEVGLGYWSYGTEPGGISKPFPGVLAGAGVFDITGQPAAMLHLAQAVWGVTSAPGIAVRPLDKGGQRANKTPWLASDAISSWSWRGRGGKAEIEVYSHADHVELFLNGRSLGRKRAGVRRKFVARFETSYEPGELTAVAYRGGVEIGRSTLRSATAVSLQLRAEPTYSDANDVQFVWVELGDDDGVVDSIASDRVQVTVHGAGELAGFGSANPAHDDDFTSGTAVTYRGRALVAIRRVRPDGHIVVSVTSRRHGDAGIVLDETGATRTSVPTTARSGV